MEEEDAESGDEWALPGDDDDDDNDGIDDGASKGSPRKKRRKLTADNDSNGNDEAGTMQSPAANRSPRQKTTRHSPRRKKGGGLGDGGVDGDDKPRSSPARRRATPRSLNNDGPAATDDGNINTNGNGNTNDKEKDKDNDKDKDNSTAARAVSAVAAQHLAATGRIPTDVELDTDMMEHLARAAMELHNQRTGRGMQHESNSNMSASGANGGGANGGGTDATASSVANAAGMGSPGRLLSPGGRAGSSAAAAGAEMKSPPSGGSRRGRKPSTAAPRYHYPMPPPVMGPNGQPVPQTYPGAGANPYHPNPYMAAAAGFPYHSGHMPPPPGPMAAAAAAAATAGMAVPPPGAVPSGAVPGQPLHHPGAPMPPPPHGNAIAATMVASHAQQQQQQHPHPQMSSEMIVPPVPPQGAGGAEAKPSAVAWTSAERQRAREALAKFGSDNIDDFVRAVGTRSEAQVRAHLRNVQSREVISAAVKKEEEMDGDDSAQRNGANASASGVAVIGSATAKSEEAGIVNPSGAVAANKANGASSSKLAGGAPSSMAVANGATKTTGSDADGDIKGGTVAGEPTKRRGGRTKRAPTSALHTVPNANFDARSLLSTLGRK